MYSLCGSRHQNTIQQTRRASIDTAVFLARTGAVSHVSECLCVCVWVCVKTYLNIISQTCQVANVPAIQRDNGSLGSASVRIFCDCVWICVYVSAVEGGPIMKHVTCVTFCVAFSLAFAIRVGKHTFHHLDTGAYNHAMMCTHVLDKHTKLTRAGTFTCSFIQTHKLPNTHSDFILWPYVYGDVTVTQV